MQTKSVSSFYAIGSSGVRYLGRRYPEQKLTAAGCGFFNVAVLSLLASFPIIMNPLSCQNCFNTTLVYHIVSYIVLFYSFVQDYLRQDCRQYWKSKIVLEKEKKSMTGSTCLLSTVYQGSIPTDETISQA